jgi:hypothetical protein
MGPRETEELRAFGRDWNGFFGWSFQRSVQRRGTHVSPPKIGSRDG